MEAFPAFFPLRGKRVVIAGEGDGARAKARLFDGSPAEVSLVDGEAAARPATYAGALLAFVAGADADFRRAAAAAARAAHVPVNVVDDPALCDFHTPAVIDRGQVVAAVGTAGAAPLLAALLRNDIEARIPQGAGRIAALLGARREAVREAFPDMTQRRAFLRSVLEGPAARSAMAGDMALASRLLDEAVAAGFSAVGRVTFIHSAEAPDLICLRAARVLAEADVIVAADDEGLAATYARREARRIAPAAASAAELAELARGGQQVVVVVADEDAEFSAAVRDFGVAVEILRPAPAP